MFQSFFQGGFDCAAHRRRDRRQVDVQEQTGHGRHASQDFQLLREAGVLTVRDGLRWHRIERRPGVYDWSSWLPVLDAALLAGTEVIWDLCHWGVPRGLDVFSDEFPERFAAFAGAAAALLRDRSGGLFAPTPWWVPINEISFWSWVGAEVGAFSPHAHGRGMELKRQLVRATVQSMRAVRAVDPSARFVQPEPIIDITPNWRNTRRWPHLEREARHHTDAQYGAMDMLCGNVAPELGGAGEYLDVVGANYYWDSQWVHHGERKPLGHPAHKPVHLMLLELWERYRRPILLSETGAEGSADVGWLGYIAAEVRQARREGAEVVGICLYPVSDYPGWDDGRHCRCGLIAIDDAWQGRELRGDLVRELQLQRRTMELAAGEGESILSPPGFV